MKTLLFLLVLALGILNVSQSFGQSMGSTLADLDQYMANRGYYIGLKEDKINNLKKELAREKSPIRQYNINNRIYEEYNTYRYDSAMHYVLRNKEIAQTINNPQYLYEVRLHESLLLATTGMYRESIDLLNTVDSRRIDSAWLCDYYKIAEWIYYATAEYSRENNPFRTYYLQKEREYRDSLLLLLEPETMEYKYYKGKKILFEGNLVEAKKILLSVLHELKPDTRRYAQTTFYIAEIYKLEENRDMYQKYITLAAISDQICPLKENQAMQDLALFLYTTNPKEVDRAYNYIQCAMADARFYNNRLRMVQIARKLPIIVQAYQAKGERENSMMRLMLIGITMLSLLMILALCYIGYQIRQVKKSRREIVFINRNLETLNDELAQANSVKEEYIGLFLDLSSSYLDKINAYRETVKRKVKAHQINDLLNMVSSSKMMDKELQEFFHKFDIAFLKLFPDFIDKTNALLNDDQHLIPRKDTLMNTELRILALIRLGINDSSRIASFLRYSPQTIYNYRAKVKAKAKNRKSEFENQIREIGSLPTK